MRMTASCLLAGALLLTGHANAGGAEDLFCRSNKRVIGTCQWVKGHLHSARVWHMLLTPDAAMHPDLPEYWVEMAPVEIAQKWLMNSRIGFVGRFEVCPLSRDERTLRKPEDMMACVQASEGVTVLPQDASSDVVCKLMACRERSTSGQQR